MKLRSEREIDISTGRNTNNIMGPKHDQHPQAHKVPAVVQASAPGEGTLITLSDNDKLGTNLIVVLIVNIILVIPTYGFISFLQLLTSLELSNMKTTLAISLIHAVISLASTNNLMGSQMGVDEFTNPLFSHPFDFFAATLLIAIDIIKYEFLGFLGLLIYWSGIVSGLFNCVLVLTVVAGVVGVIWCALRT